jgi:hypothetical protein
MQRCSKKKDLLKTSRTKVRAQTQIIVSRRGRERCKVVRKRWKLNLLAGVLTGCDFGEEVGHDLESDLFVVFGHLGNEV